MAAPPVQTGKKGEFHIEIKEAELSTKEDPYCVIFLGKEDGMHQKTRTKSVLRTKRPKWGETFLLDTYTETNKVRLVVMDKDLASADDAICECEFEVGGTHGNEFEGWIELKCMASERKHKTRRVANYGKIHVKWMYNYRSAIGQMFALGDYKDEEEPDPSLNQVIEIVFKLLLYVYQLAACFFFMLDNFMWKKPFACAGQLLLIYVLAFHTNYGLDAMLPATGALFMYWSRLQKQHHGAYWLRSRDLTVPQTEGPSITVPAHRLRRTMPALQDLLKHSSRLVISPALQKNSLKVAYVWCSTLCSYFETIERTLTWQRPDVSGVIFHGLLISTVVLYFFGLPLHLWRYGVFLGFLYMYILFPIYYSFPKIRERYGPKATGNIIVKKLHETRQQIKGYLSALVPKPTHLSTIPIESRSYEDWLQFSKQREKERQKYGVDTPPTLASPLKFGDLPDKKLEPLMLDQQVQSDQVTSLRVHVDELRGFTANVPDLLVKVYVGSNKFKTPISQNGKWMSTYSFPPVSGPVCVELWNVVPVPNLIAKGTFKLSGTDAQTWIELISNDGVHLCDVNISFVYVKGSVQAAVPEVVRNHDPILNLAAQLYELKNFKGLHSHLVGLSRAHPHNAEVSWWLARCCYDLGADPSCKNPTPIFESGLKTAEDCTVNHPTVAGGYKWCGILQARLCCTNGIESDENFKKHVSVRHYLSKATELDPTDAATWYHLGVWHYTSADSSWRNKAKGSFQEAQLYLQRSLSIQPRSHLACLLMGDTYLKMKDKTLAGKWYKHIATLPPFSASEEQIQAEAVLKLANL
eukprot:TRINITY_DN12758_c0_g1_i1.p1 TRINITY_DN12758_c0_g1~~TRINITY_DN12758_c0_g1_i1.p1  ORF type:complete len:808 (+),score=109.11 TRINITY_DN12758_c0_g1_i1:81-2504(+)